MKKMKTIMFAGVFLMMLPALLMPQSLRAAEGFDKYASGSDLGKTKEVESYGMLPIYGRDIEDGSYEIEVRSSSTFFRVEKAALNVKDGEMDAVITMSSSSYNYVYLGEAKDAAQAEMSDYIPYKEVADYYTFSFPVTSLNHKFKLAAFSKRKKKWYDREILFDASTLPEGALKIDLPNYDKIEKAIALYDETKEEEKVSNQAQKNEDSKDLAVMQAMDAMTPSQPMDYDLADGEYSIELDMTGGSGRASVSSPTLFVIKDGKAYAQLIWSSTYYDYMIVGGEKYENLNQESGGNSTFLIPIARMDESIPVIGDTTAMGDPVEINYELTFYSDSVGSKSMIPQEAAKRVLVIGLGIIAVGGIINQIFKKRRFS